MKASIAEAEGRLDELVRRAEAGEEVILTHHGKPRIRLEPVDKAASKAVSRRALLEEIQRSARLNATPGPSAARSQDFLYDEDGLPG
ncbi:type II toxin-antitoxin system Phd/YefM family antitoxin [Jiella sonneratiae]|uniref:Antitoxin n=1 Tax=Jiella sonneratiae TaxID=2816856 RepID=A0ABS3J1Y7_9HYPH|nr:type II toxin-antitoxin system prevent-host-death family antitoxin [Jiella sonneratiae]MBO0903694.1 type II toxin-antitoxin system prevent-host-death family antitoxin [Jiella sonneratiae]